MKKLFLLLAFASSIMFVAQSCRKMDLKKDHEGKVVYQTVEATIKANETYTFTLPANTSDDPFEITSQASHYRISQLENSATSYRYSPATDYVGSDKVVISTAKEQQNGHHSGGGNCNQNHHDQETELVIIINLTIKGTSSTKQ